MLERKSQGFTLLWSLGFLEHPLSALGATTLPHSSKVSPRSKYFPVFPLTLLCLEALPGPALNFLCCDFLSASWDKQESGLHLTLLSILSLPKKPDQTPGRR